MFLLKFLALGLPVRLRIVEFFPHNRGLLSTSKGKIPEYLIEHLEHANAEQWNLLKGFPILPKPANKMYSKYAIYAMYAIYANTYTRIEAFNKASTSAAFLGNSAGEIVLMFPVAASFTRK
jgi:hypothetical protein